MHGGYAGLLSRTSACGRFGKSGWAQDPNRTPAMPTHHRVRNRPVLLTSAPSCEQVLAYLKDPSNPTAVSILDEMGIKASELTIDRIIADKGHQHGINCIWNLCAMPFGDNAYFKEADTPGKRKYVGDVAFAVAEAAQEVFQRKNEMLHDWGFDEEMLNGVFAAAAVASSRR